MGGSPAPSGEDGAYNHPTGAVSLIIAGVASFSAVSISGFQIYKHLKYYNEPLFQRYVVRIVFMVPLYALFSWFSLLYHSKAIYFDSVRDCYESFVIYTFLSLCLDYVGGPGAIVAAEKVVEPSWTWGTCCLPTMQVNGAFLRFCKQGTLQFVIFKPLMALLALVLHGFGAFHEGDWNPAGGYLWITIFYNVTYTLALYALLLFYIGTHDLLDPFKPMLKFIMIKVVIFLTFWQGLLIAIFAPSFGLAPEEGKAVQNFCICLEMLAAAAMMVVAFPHKEYKYVEGVSTVGKGRAAISHVINFSDVIRDVNRQFAPTYGKYVLYNDEETTGIERSANAVTPEPKKKGGKKGRKGAEAEAADADTEANGGGSANHLDGGAAGAHDLTRRSTDGSSMGGGSRNGSMLSMAASQGGGAYNVGSTSGIAVAPPDFNPFASQVAASKLAVAAPVFNPFADDAAPAGSPFTLGDGADGDAPAPAAAAATKLVPAIVPPPPPPPPPPAPRRVSTNGGAAGGLQFASNPFDEMAAAAALTSAAAAAAAPVEPPPAIGYGSMSSAPSDGATTAAVAEALGAASGGEVSAGSEDGDEAGGASARDGSKKGGDPADWDSIPL